MDGDLSLFGDEPPTVTAPAAAPAAVAGWQIDMLRRALDARGLASMEDRQRLIEDSVGRPVESLRMLTHEEALRALAKLGADAPVKKEAASAWDERDEDTWIDRL
jgi:DNA polymerase-3 subunit epsilon